MADLKMNIEEFTKVCEIAFKAMYKAALKATRNKEDAEDAVQNSFLYFMDKLYHKSLRNIKPAFLARNAYLRGIDIVRKQRRHELILANEKLGGIIVFDGSSSRLTKGRSYDKRNPEGMALVGDERLKVDNSGAAEET